MSEGYKARMKMHLNRGANGSTIISELVDYPGVTVADHYDKKQRKTTRVIVYNDTEFKTLDEAVKAWKPESA